MDRVSQEQRSRNMAAIRSRDGKTTETNFAKQLRAAKIVGWRKNPKKNFGAPDFIFLKEKVVLFIDGCFWHGCKRHCIMPKSNRAYWHQKIARNKLRDRTVNSYYGKNKWLLFRIWEHDVRAGSKKALISLKKSLARRRI